MQDLEYYIQNYNGDPVDFVVTIVMSYVMDKFMNAVMRFLTWVVSFFPRAVSSYATEAVEAVDPKTILQVERVGQVCLHVYEGDTVSFYTKRVANYLMDCVIDKIGGRNIAIIWVVVIVIRVVLIL